MSANSNPSNPLNPQPDAGRQIAEAHSLLMRLKERLTVHPELDEAIEKLELALSVLTTKTGGML